MLNQSVNQSGRKISLRFETGEFRLMVGLNGRVKDRLYANKKRIIDDLKT